MIDGVDNFVVCGGFVLESLGAVCLEENVSMLLDACVTDVESSRVADVIHDLVKDAKDQSA